MSVLIKTPQEIEIIAEGGKRLAEIMKELKKAARPGMTTKALDRLAENLIFKLGGKCSFKGYKNGSGQPFPACLCSSINNEIVHAVPSERIIKEGDLLSLDLGIFYQGFHTDMAETLAIGRASPLAEKLIIVTREALRRGIKVIKPGRHFGDIGFTIQEYVESQGFNVIRELCGHGIGRQLHEEPEILNYGRREDGPELVKGMVFCLEPMLTTGNWRIKKAENGFAYETMDNSLSCHFEHTVAITENGVRVLTA